MSTEQYIGHQQLKCESSIMIIESHDYVRNGDKTVRIFTLVFILAVSKIDVSTVSSLYINH